MPSVVRPFALFVLTLLLVPLSAVVTAAPASADTPFTVNSSLDAPDAALNGTCATAGGVCTLRAALQEAASAGGTVVRITIDLPADTTITLGNHVSIPPNTTVDGCADDASRPCVTLSGDFAGAPVRVSGQGAALRNVAVVSSESASVGIALSGADTTLSQVWVGMTTLGVAHPLSIGVRVTGDRASIGSEYDEFRTTIVNAATGIEVSGADYVAVNATNLGLNADGAPGQQNGHDVAGGQVGILVAENGADVPQSVNIGNTLSAGQHATPACDGVCNAIGQMSQAGIRVAPGAVGASVYVNGSYLGLASDGTTPAAAPGAVGIDAGPGFVQAGTNGPASRNVIAGGAYGVRQTGPEGSVSIQETLIGTDATGAIALAPTVVGIAADGDYAGVSSSRIVVASDATGVVLNGDEGTVTGNVFGLLADGTAAPMAHAVRVVGDRSDIGSTVVEDRNVICSASGAAVVIAGGDRTTVSRNRIGVDEVGAACTGQRANGSGVVVKDVGGDVATRNSIGSVLGSGNTVSNSLHNAITIASTGHNKALHNTGSGNAGLMLDVGGLSAGKPDDGDGPGNPAEENGNVSTPQVQVARDALVSGDGGGAGDYVYLYATDSAAGTAPHGVGALLGQSQVKGDGNGLWTITPAAPISPGTRVAVVSESRSPDTGDAVSEFSTVVTVVATPGGPGTTTPLTVAGSPTLKGRARVGKRLKVVIPASAPTGAVVSVQWLVGRRVIAGATGPALKLGGRHLGRKVSARVTWTLPGSAPVVLTTARIRVKR
ncbi:hypothetical protein ACFFOS_20295 [Nocardioides kongjuensis]|uniref:CSLREA domain-containing protein n=1 Tax=Nocardioides kongjuensis TaxID=349522 RepID=A0A852RER8_9ACTN|nr:hypothetical protein [Nocardioides kongjuensis]NYD31777.1 hypothetical protein [Nocardioides kongjuensis]